MFMTGFSGLCAATALVLMVCGPAQACTSFVDYSTGTAWYGMNFDWQSDQDILFRMETSMDGQRVFTMSFLPGGRPVPTVGMTADGRFSSLQVTDSPWTGPPASEGNSVIHFPFYALIYRGAGMDDIAHLVRNDTFTQYDDLPLHVITADSSGRVMIIEVGARRNDILKRSVEPFLVMTNFPVCDWTGVAPDLIEGAGADRYRNALGVLEANEGGMCPDAGLAVLESAESTSPDFPTRASMVFDAVHARVYIAVYGDFKRVWVLDMGSGMLDGWRGLASGDPVLVDSVGITGSQLHSGN